MFDVKISTVDGENTNVASLADIGRYMKGMQNKDAATYVYGLSMKKKDNSTGAISTSTSLFIDLNAVSSWKLFVIFSRAILILLREF